MPVLRVRAHLETPVALSTPLHLDSIMAQCSDGMSDHVTRSDDAAALRQPDIPCAWLPHSAGRIHVASAAEPSPDAEYRAEHLTRRRDAGDLDHLTRRIETRSGPGRDIMLRFPAIAAEYLEWWCVGRRQAVRRLLGRRVRHVGRMRRHGYGAVREWVIDAIDRPPSDVLVRDGRARRNMPADWLDAPAITEQVPVRAPYWHASTRFDGIAAMRPAELSSRIRKEVDALC